MNKTHSYIVSSLPSVAVSFLCLVTAATLLPHQVLAQQGRPPVVDAAGAVSQVPNAPAAPSASAASVNNDLVFSLYQQIEQLQNEMATLRGIVEEQGHQLRRMQSEQRDRYLDLDRRLSGASGGGGASGREAENIPTPDDMLLDEAIMLAPLPVAGMDERPVSRPSGSPATQSPGTDRSASAQGVVNDRSGDLAPTPENEQDIYRLALNLLLEEGQYDESIRQFQRYIHYYPSGRYLTNAYYWQGEAMILEGRYDEAERTFRRVVDDYPQDPKAAGALLKMGVAFSQMGNRDRARETWESIRARYPDSMTEIRAAEDYLNRLGR